MPSVFGEEVTFARAVGTVRRVLDSPINFIDTSNNYSAGESERRIGHVIMERGGLPSGFVLSTKVDRHPRTGSFSAARVRKSAEESLARLGIDRFQLLFLHDPEGLSWGEATSAGGPVDGLLRLKSEGIAEHIGVAAGPVSLLRRYIRTGLFDVVLTHNRFTLVDRSAEPLLADAERAGLGVLNAAVFGGGILAKGAEGGARYAYRRASAALLNRITLMSDICRFHGTSLKAAALHLSLRDPRIHSTVVGTSRPEHVDELLSLVAAEVPAELWPALDRVLKRNE